MAEANSNALTWVGYGIEEGLCFFVDAADDGLQIPITQVVNDDALIARLSPSDALRIGAWFADYRDACTTAEIAALDGGQHHG